jgi:hypothetical protein
VATPYACSIAHALRHASQRDRARDPGRVVPQAASRAWLPATAWRDPCDSGTAWAGIAVLPDVDVTVATGPDR